jgi:hypothetical protein
MKKLLHSILFLITCGLIGWQLTACKRTPAPPTEQDAIAVWKNTHSKTHMEDLISLSKTNGQLEEANGVKIYTIYFRVKEKSTVQLGNRPPGTETEYQGNYPFQWTEKGWMGPDKQIYPEH